MTNVYNLLFELQFLPMNMNKTEAVLPYPGKKDVRFAALKDRILGVTLSCNDPLC